MKESAGISARNCARVSGIEVAGEVSQNASLVFHQAVHRSHSFSSMYAPIFVLGFAYVALVRKKRGDKFQCADA
jgi:hypothetical protein